jgi:hypothetical protein
MTQLWPVSRFAARAGRLAVLIALTCRICCAEQPSQVAVAGFDAYVGALEAQLAAEHRQKAGFVVLAGSSAQTLVRLQRGELVIENLTPANVDLPGAMIYHWRGAAFVPGATAADLERILRNFAAYPQIYVPQVLSANILSQNGDRYQATMRLRQKHVISVVLDITYDIAFGRLDVLRGWSTSRSTHIDEINNAGTKSERVLTPADQHGFLWRLNTYWTYEEHDGGVYMQIESVSLVRSIPPGLRWAIGPFVESVPRESLEFTLRATCHALRRECGPS